MRLHVGSHNPVSMICTHSSWGLHVSYNLLYNFGICKQCHSLVCEIQFLVSRSLHEKKMVHVICVLCMCTEQCEFLSIYLETVQ